jgi:NAD(P)-dependent dehydrogenase (short-subunit alcohol dehydrogenase family)
MNRPKVVVVTGSEGLLGREIVLDLSNKGFHVIRADKSLEDGGYCYYLDITDEGSVQSLLSKLVDKFEFIDGWVNNAYPRTKDWGNDWNNIEFSSWQRNVDMHLNGYFLCMHRVSEVMTKQGFGSIVNLSSIYGIVGPDFSVYENTEMTMPAAYSAIKGAIINLTRYLAARIGPDGVRVNCVSPGGILDGQPETFVAAYCKKVPLRRLGLPSDIAPAISFLVSEEAKYITGQNLVIDGGWTSI